MKNVGEIMEEKYIELLLDKCVDKKSKILFIHYQKEISPFIQKLVKRAKELGIRECFREEEDINRKHRILKASTKQSILTNPYFNKENWDFYAKKNAAFLCFETEYPTALDDIPDDIVAYAAKRERETRPLYRKMVENCTLSWCIAAYPGKKWAEFIFKEEENSYEKLRQDIFKICMLDQEDPIKCWEKQLAKTEKTIETLNQLNLKKIHYTNQLGTNLDLYLPKHYQFASAKDGQIIVNMPSYEIFSSPLYDKTEGIVYSSKPLNYNGKIVDEFGLKFAHGKVIDYDARVGKDILKEIIEGDENSCYLGEFAFVEENSPIADLKITFGTTLIDENASCHLALGAGFGECIKDGLSMSTSNLLEKGINQSKIHVDFMIGTPDLSITGITEAGESIPIFENGNFTPSLQSSKPSC